MFYQNLVQRSAVVPSDMVSEEFANAYDSLRELFDQDKLDECIAGCQDLLDVDCPRYIRIKALILLGSSAADWQDTEDCRNEAETLWHLARRLRVEGEDAGVEEALSELRSALDHLGRAQIERQLRRKMRCATGGRTC